MRVQKKRNPDVPQIDPKVDEKRERFEKNQCVGITRGGRNTKIHAVVDALGNPIHVQLSSGDIHDSGITEDVLDHVELEPNGTAVLADKAGQEGICRMRFRPVTEVWNRFTKSEEYSAESGSLVIHAAGEPLLMKTSWKPCNIKEVSAGGLLGGLRHGRVLHTAGTQHLQLGTEI